MGSSSDVVSSTIAKKWREHPPSSYSLKVDNFIQLEKFASTSDDKYQSRLFSSGGYNWYGSSTHLAYALRLTSHTF
ncbi:BnaUnng05230D [Brassica napus]|uniref:BnaUnng05230D protein n=1 Tax=Brassica napus TaxID=3708 RepID=A0A078K1B9_BRANA|nr:BnaUnng05230D [Brassica napus]